MLKRSIEKRTDPLLADSQSHSFESASFRWMVSRSHLTRLIYLFIDSKGLKRLRQVGMTFSHAHQQVRIIMEFIFQVPQHDKFLCTILVVYQFITAIKRCSPPKLYCCLDSKESTKFNIHGAAGFSFKTLDTSFFVAPNS